MVSDGYMGNERQRVYVFEQWGRKRYCHWCRQPLGMNTPKVTCQVSLVASSRVFYINLCFFVCLYSREAEDYKPLPPWDDPSQFKSPNSALIQLNQLIFKPNRA
jgi:hypothetical protein